MKTKIKKEEKNVTLEVQVELEKIEAERDRLFRKYLRELMIPGFRKGKVPPKIGRRYVTDELLSPEIIENLVPAALTEALKKEKLIPLNTPSFDIKELKVDQPLVFSASFEVKPEIEVKDYKGIEVKLPPGVKVKKEEIKEVLKGLQRASAKKVPLQEDRALKEGDFAFIDFESFDRGKPVPNGSAKNFEVELKEDKFIPGFMEKLLGMKPGETRQFNITFPQEYPNDLKGHEIEFKVELKEVKVIELPELDDDFAKAVSSYQTFAELEESIKKDLIQRKELKQNQETEEKILEILFSQVPPPIPPAYLEYQREYLIRDMMKQLAWAGDSLEGYLQKNNLTLDQLKQHLTPQAERLAKEELILDGVVRAEIFTVSPEEIEKEIGEFAQRTNQEPKKVKEMMEKEDTLDFFTYTLLKRKAREFLRNNARNIAQAKQKSPKP